MQILNTETLMYSWSIYCKTLIIRVTLFYAISLPRIYSRDFIFVSCHILIYNPYIRNYWQGLYFCISVPPRIYAHIKSSLIKHVLQYIYHLTRATPSRCKIRPTGEFMWEIMSLLAIYKRFLPCLQDLTTMFDF